MGRHLIHLFASSFYRWTMLNLRHRGGKYLVVKMEDKGSQQFWIDYFFVKTEAIAANVNGLPKAWNHSCSLKGDTRRNMAPFPTFRRRRTATPSASAHISVAVPSASAPSQLLRSFLPHFDTSMMMMKSLPVMGT
nr:uncharacterized protein LOC117276733 [Nicotiana tomentosiformis]